MKILTTLAAVIAAIAALLVFAPAASAISWYCQDNVSPVTISATRTGPHTVRITTGAPINSNAKIFTDGAIYLGTVHVSAGSSSSYQVGANNAQHYWIANYGDSGQVWYGPGGKTLAYCHSPQIYY